MKIKILSVLLRKIRATVTSEQFKRIEDIILNVAEESGDAKVRAAAKLLRVVLDVED